jgi:hypothetical protein
VSRQLLHRETKTTTSDAALPLPDICVAALRLRKAKVLTAYSYTDYAADLVRTTLVVNPQHFTCADHSRRESPWSLRDRLSEDVVDGIVDDYRRGRTARQHAESHDVSLSSIKRILRKRGIRKDTSHSAAGHEFGLCAISVIPHHESLESIARSGCFGRTWDGSGR